jgi:MoaA/NifB/PqqE/SkfB family radical SAM enzyme
MSTTEAAVTDPVWIDAKTLRKRAAPTDRERSPRPELAGVLRPFASADDARATVRSLGRLLDEGAVPRSSGAAVGASPTDARLLLLIAKALDETTGEDLLFTTEGLGDDETAIGKRFAALLRTAGNWLAHVTKEAAWPVVEVTSEAARGCLELLGPFSILLTSTERGGEDVLRALFDEVVGGDGALPPGSAFTREGAATALLDRTAFKTRSSRLRTIVVAGMKAYGSLDRLKARNLEWMRGNYKKGVVELTNFPKLIHVELSTHCNLRCRTCSITRPGRRRVLGYLSMETLENLRPALPFVSDCKLHGGGEPFMHPQIEQVLRVFRDEGVRLNTVTNAVLIRERLARLIGETFSTLTVSVDGADKETFEYVRLQAKWEKLLRGLDLLNEHRGPDFRLIIGVVMLKCNIHQLPDFVRFAHEHGAQEMQAAWLVPFHDLPWTQTQALTDDPVRTNAFMDEARAVGDELGVSVRIPDNLPVDGAASATAVPVQLSHPNERGADRAGDAASTIVALDHEATYWNLHGTDRVEGHCRLMYDRAMVLADGNVKPCGQSRYVRELGSVNERSFEQCWNGVGYQDLRATFNGGTLPKTCMSCNFIRSKQLGTARLVY